MCRDQSLIVAVKVKILPSLNLESRISEPPKTLLVSSMIRPFSSSLDHGWNWSEDKPTRGFPLGREFADLSTALLRGFFPFYFIDLVRLPARLNPFKLHPNAYVTVCAKATLGFKERKCIGKTVNHRGFFQCIVESFTDAVTEAQHQHKVVVSIRKKHWIIVLSKNFLLLSKIATQPGM